MHLVRRGRRAVAALSATALLAVAVSPALASEAEKKDLEIEDLSVATVGETTVLGVDAGELLQLRLLGEDGLAGLDLTGDVREALTRLAPLDISSGTLPVLNGVTLPTVEAHSTGGEKRTETQAVSLGDLLPVNTAALLDGTIDPASLLALVNDDRAEGLLTASVSNLSALAGLIGIENIDIDLGGTAATTDADADRSVKVGQVNALDLTGLLQLVGLDLLDLSLEQLLGLAGELDVLNAVLGPLGLSTGALDALLAGLTDLGDPGAAIDSIQSALATAQANLDAEVQALCNSLIGGLPIPLPVACGQLQEVTDLVNHLQAQLNLVLDLVDQLLGLVDGLLAILDGAPLLAFGGLDAGVFATAARTVDDSIAEVDATIGDVLVAGQVLPGLDVGATLAQVNALASQVTEALDSVLAVVGLDGLLDVGVLETTESVDEVDGVITAVAELTGLRITITPPNLCDLLTGIDPTGTVGGLLDGLDETLPDLDLPVGDLLGELDAVLECSTGAQTMTGGLLDGVANALTQPLTIRAASISETSTFSLTGSAPKPASSPETPEKKSMPRTGGSNLLLPLAVAMAAAVLGTRFVLRRRS